MSNKNIDAPNLSIEVALDSSPFGCISLGRRWAGLKTTMDSVVGLGLVAFHLCIWLEVNLIGLTLYWLLQ